VGIFTLLLLFFSFKLEILQNHSFFFRAGSNPGTPNPLVAGSIPATPAIFLFP
jgi:hypothetical protein